MRSLVWLLRSGSAENLPVEDESIDTVVSTHVLCSVTDLQASLQEIKRILKPGGSFIFHVCLVCDGYEMTDKQAGLFVGSEASIETAFALSWFTPKITVFTHGLFEVSESMSTRLKDFGYRLVETPIKEFLGENHQMSGVELVDDSVVELETGLLAMGSRYHHTYLSNFNLEKEGNYSRHR